MGRGVGGNKDDGGLPALRGVDGSKQAPENNPQDAMNALGGRQMDSDQYYKDLFDLQKRTFADMEQAPIDDWVSTQYTAFRDLEGFSDPKGFAGKDQALFNNQILPSPALDQWLREAYKDPDARITFDLFASVNRCSNDPSTQQVLLRGAYEELDDEDKNRIEEFVKRWGSEAAGALVGGVAGRYIGDPSVAAILAFIAGGIAEQRVEDGIDALSRKRGERKDVEARQRLRDLFEGGP